MSKTLLEIFNRYEPSAEFADILRSADPETIKLRADKPQRLIEVSAAFPHIIQKRTLYKLEEDIRQAYRLNMVRICPHYPSEQFTQDLSPTF